MYESSKNKFLYLNYSGNSIKPTFIIYFSITNKRYFLKIPYKRNIVKNIRYIQ